MTVDSNSNGIEDAPSNTSEARLRRAQRVARLGSWELDLRTKIIWGSDEAFRIYGLPPTPDNSLPYDIVKLIPLPAYRTELDRALNDLLRKGTPYEIRFRIHRHEDGAIRDVHSFAEAARDGSGNPVLITGTVQDVTEHEEATRKLRHATRANEERARLIIEQAADAIFLVEPNGRFLLVNEQATELTGYRREELLGRGYRLFFDHEVLREEPLRDDLLEQGETVIRDRMLTRRDGTQIAIEMRSKKLSDGSYQSILRDISKRKRLEEQLYLRQRMDSLGTLAGGIAHDFNNILAAIVGYADSLRLAGSLDDSARKKTGSNILQSCRRAADLVRGLQMFTRHAPVKNENFDLFSVTSEVFRVLDETTNRLISKEMLIPEGRFPVVGNPSAVYHALMNLGINAVQAIEEKGADPDDFVRVEASDYVVRDSDPLPLAHGSYVHVTVRDTGMGMSDEVKNRAFDLLYTTKEKGERKGQGLGLALVYNVVVRHHRGLVDIETTEGEGSTFHLYLPRGTMPAADDSSPTPTFRGGSETILVVEDEPAIASLTQEVLESLGYTVLTAADGQEGLDLYRENRADIDLVILDRTLPKLSGEQVLQQMQECEPDVKVIVSSGDTTVDLGLFPGALAILHKPYRLAALFDTIREVIDLG